MCDIQMQQDHQWRIQNPPLADISTFMHAGCQRQVKLSENNYAVKIRASDNIYRFVPKNTNTQTQVSNALIDIKEDKFTSSCFPYFCGPYFFVFLSPDVFLPVANGQRGAQCQVEWAHQKHRLQLLPNLCPHSQSW